MIFRRLVLAGWVLAAVALPVAAQELRGPNELPPAGYTGDAYADSGGCVFLRANVGGRVAWAPRLNRARAQVCGQVPTFAPAPPAPASPPAADPVAATAAADPAPQAAAKAPPPAAAKPAAAPAVRVRAAPRAAPRADCARVGHVALRDRRTLAVCVAADAALAEGGPGSRTAALPLAIDRGGRRQVGCPAGAPVAARFALPGQGSTVLCVPSGGPALLAAVPRGYSPVPDPAPAARPVAGSAGRFVQVGSFAVATNADAARQRLAALDLPVAEGRGRIGGRAVRVVFAGPFAEAEAAQAALRATRSAGFGDAFLR